MEEKELSDEQRYMWDKLKGKPKLLDYCMQVRKKEMELYGRINTQSIELKREDYYDEFVDLICQYSGKPWDMPQWQSASKDMIMGIEIIWV